jgi:predicted aldo/keto reductase-like oxidoreductase
MQSEQETVCRVYLTTKNNSTNKQKITALTNKNLGVTCILPLHGGHTTVYM